MSDIADAAAPSAPASSASGHVETLTKRTDFLRAARARRTTMPGFVLQARDRGDSDDDAGALRVGFTCSKKVGNAVARNRAKRRLRAIARDVLHDCGRPGWDYVLIGRKDVTATRPYDQMCRDLERAIATVHA